MNCKNFFLWALCNVFDIDSWEARISPHFAGAQYGATPLARSSTFSANTLFVMGVPSKTEKKRNPRMQFWGGRVTHHVQRRRCCTVVIKVSAHPFGLRGSRHRLPRTASLVRGYKEGPSFRDFRQIR